MPFTYAHDHCAKRVLSRLKEQDANALRGEERLYRAGAQGPDAFFYHRILPFHTKGHYRLFAKRLHTQRVGSVMAALLRGLTASAAPFANKCFAYFSGYLCHYALDCAAHPYIFNRAGFGSSHTRFESDIDSALLRLHNKEISAVYPDLLTPPSKADRGVAGAFLGRALNAAFGQDAPPAAACADAIRDLYKAQRLIYDPLGLKRGAVGALEKLLHADGIFTAAIIPKIPDISLDSLNVARKPWREPWEGGLQSDVRFVELLEHAADDAARMISAVSAHLLGSSSESDVLSIIGSRNFHSGLDCCVSPAFVEVGTGGRGTRFF